LFEPTAPPDGGRDLGFSDFGGNQRGRRCLIMAFALGGRFAMGLLDFLFGRRGADRDGSSPEKAIVVGSVGEEYAWMQRHNPGFQPEMQSLQHIEGKPYDVLTWRNDNGEERTVYFDISEFFGH
jgi:hypothetical protein